MIVRIITVYVRKEHIDAFEDATTKNHEGSVREPGVLRFDVLKHGEEPGKYVLYEVYRDHAATLAHKETSHYKEWKEKVGPMMDGHRSSESYDVVAPLDEAAW